MKRVVTLLVAALIMLSSSMSISAYAVERKFDIDDYTIESFSVMSSDEKLEVINKFIEAYNPYGIKDLTTEEGQSDEIQLLWVSDSDKLKPDQQAATHQLITAQAFLTFVSNYGFYDLSGSDAMLYMLTLAAASGLPDKDEIGFFVFAGHFYDPDNEQNYVGDTSPTAKTNAQDHYTEAYNRLKTNVNMPIWGDDSVYVIEKIGRCLHYIQDACEPHHASNKKAGVSTHSQFESFVNDNIESYISDLNSTPSYYYTSARNKSAGELTKQAAQFSKPLYSSVSSLFIRDNWGNVGKMCTTQAVYYSAGIIYKLFHECGASFAG